MLSRSRLEVDGVGPAALAISFAIACLFPALGPPDQPLATPQYFSLEPGTPARSGDNFSVPIFVLGEPGGGPANRSDTEQAWQSLHVTYVGPAGGDFGNWSVTTWGPGWFALLASLSDGEVSSIDAGGAILALNATVEEDGTVLAASGTIGADTLLSATVPTGWWTTWFGIGSPPPPANPTLQGVLDWLAWWGDSTPGRASYAAATLVAIGLYLWEGHKLARRALTGAPRRAGEAT